MCLRCRYLDGKTQMLYPEPRDVFPCDMIQSGEWVGQAAPARGHVGEGQAGKCKTWGAGREAATSLTAAASLHMWRSCKSLAAAAADVAASTRACPNPAEECEAKY